MVARMKERKKKSSTCVQMNYTLYGTITDSTEATSAESTCPSIIRALQPVCKWLWYIRRGSAARFRGMESEGAGANLRFLAV